MISFPYTVDAPKNPRGTFVATVRIAVPEAVPPAEVVTYIRSAALKSDLASEWISKNAPNCGLEVYGGPRPILKDQKDRSSGVLAYEQDFRLCPRI
jgi:hypothetical protein